MKNLAILIGRVGQQPETRYTEKGTPVSSFSLATNETYKNKTTGEKVENTEWHNITAWRGVAEVIEKYVKKGDLVYIEGKLKTRSWEKDGITRYTTEIVADRLTMLGGGKQQTAAPQQETQQETDDLPF
jgi:single-strand DNA-binding protein